MAQDVEQLLIRIDATTALLRSELKRGEEAVNRFERNVEKSVSGIGSTFERLDRGLSKTRNLIGGLAVASSARELLKYSDTWRQLEGRLALITGGFEAARKKQQELFDIAQRSNTSVESSTLLYTRLAMALTEQQRAQLNVTAATETFGKALAITGASASDAQNVIVQFAQAAQSDFKAVAQEMNSLNELAPRVAQLLQRELAGEGGKSLKQMATDGELSTEKVINALERMSSTVDAEFAQIPRTVGQAMTQVDNAFLRYIGHSSAINTGTSSITAGLTGLATNFEAVADGAVLLGTAVGGRLASSLTMSTVELVKNKFAAAAQAKEALSVAAANLSAAQSTMRMAQAQTALVGATSSSRKAAMALQEAQVRYTAAATAAATATNLFKGTLAFFGGPIGLAITGVAVAMQLLSDNSEDYVSVATQVDDINLQITRHSGEYQEKLKVQRQLILDNAEARLKEAEATLKQAEAQREFLDSNAGAGGFVSSAGIGGGGAIPSAMNANRISEYKKQIELLRGEIDQAKTSIRSFEGGAGSVVNKAAQDMIDSMFDFGDAADEAGNKGSTAFKTLARDALDFKQVLKGVGDDWDAEEALRRTKASEELDRYFEEEKRQQREIRDRDAAELERQFAQPFENAAENIQNLYTDTFESVFDGSINDAGDAAKAIKKIFFRMAAEVATLAIFRPEAFAKGGGIQGAIDGIFSGGASVGSGGNSGGILGTASNLSSLFSGGKSIAGLFSGASAGAYAGAAAGAAPIAVGEIAVSSLGAATGAGAAGAGAGAAGGMGAGLAAAGPYAAAALAGIVALDALGVFKKKPSDKTQQGSTNLGPNNRFNVGGLSGKKFDQNNADARDAIFGYAESLANSILDETGEQINQQLTVRVGGRDGYRFSLGLDGIEESFSDARGLFAALTRQVVDIGEESGLAAESFDNLNTAFSHIDFSDAAKALNDINFALDFDELGEMPEELTAVEQALKEINSQFDTVRETAQRLGLSLDKVNEAEQSRIGLLRGDYVKNLNNSLLETLSPGYSQIMSMFDEYQLALKEAAALGLSAADTSKITALYELQSAQANGQAMQQQVEAAQALAGRYANITSSLSGFLKEITTGTYSGLTPTQNLGQMRSEVERLSAMARLGDADAQEQLAELLPAFVELSNNVNGGNADFEKDRAQAEEITRSTLNVTNRLQQIQQQLLGESQKQTSLLEKYLGQSATPGNANAKLIDAINAGWREAAPGMVESIFRSSGLNVEAGYGRRTAALDDPSNASVNKLLNTMFKSIGVPGFSEGGLVAGGIPNLDSVPARLMPGERVLSVEQSRMMESIYRSSNDNAAAKETAGLRKEVKALLRLTANAANQQLEAQRDIGTTNRWMARRESNHRWGDR